MVGFDIDEVVHFDDNILELEVNIGNPIYFQCRYNISYYLSKSNHNV